MVLSISTLDTKVVYCWMLVCYKFEDPGKVLANLLVNEASRISSEVMPRYLFTSGCPPQSVA